MGYCPVSKDIWAGNSSLMTALLQHGDFRFLIRLSSSAPASPFVVLHNYSRVCPIYFCTACFSFQFDHLRNCISLAPRSQSLTDLVPTVTWQLAKQQRLHLYQESHFDRLAYDCQGSRISIVGIRGCHCLMNSIDGLQCSLVAGSCNIVLPPRGSSITGDMEESFPSSAAGRTLISEPTRWLGVGKSHVSSHN
jgi:hypothetical protein